MTPVRTLLILLLSLSLTVAGAAEPKSIRDVFREMPDSLLPYLTANNRMDFIDFMDSNMKAEVHNRFDGISEMTALTSDSLSVRLSEASRLDMMLLDVDGEPVDSCSQVVCFQLTYGTYPQPQEVVTRYYTVRWKSLEGRPQLTLASEARLKRREMLTVPNWYRENLNKQ